MMETGLKVHCSAFSLVASSFLMQKRTSMIMMFPTNRKLILVLNACHGKEMLPRNVSRFAVLFV